MLGRIFVWALFWALTVCPVEAQSPQVRATVLFGPKPAAAGGFTPSCSQSTAFLARATNITLTADKTNYDALICGLVTDGVWAKLDAFWILAAPDSTSALLNLVSSSFPLTSNGTITFTARVGVVSNGTTGYYDTGFIPNAGGTNYVLNSATMGTCQSNSRAGGQTWASIGTQGVSDDRLIPNFNGSIAVVSLNGSQFNPTIANSQGLTVVDRSGATATNYYVNGSSIASDAGGTAALDATHFFLLAENNGSGTAANFSQDTITVGVVGGSLGSTLQGNLQTRLNTFFTSNGWSVSGC